MSNGRPCAQCSAAIAGVCSAFCSPACALAYDRDFVARAARRAEPTPPPSRDVSAFVASDWISVEHHMPATVVVDCAALHPIKLHVACILPAGHEGTHQRYADGGGDRW